MNEPATTHSAARFTTQNMFAPRSCLQLLLLIIVTLSAAPSFVRAQTTTPSTQCTENSFTLFLSFINSSVTLTTAFPYDQYDVTLPAVLDPSELIVVTVANTSATIPSFIFIEINGGDAVGPFDLSTPINVTGFDTAVSAVNTIAVIVNASATNIGSNGAANLSCMSTDVFTLINPTANSGCEQLDPLVANMIDPTTDPGPGAATYAAALSPLSIPYDGELITSISVRIGTLYNNTIRLFVYDENTGELFAQTAAFFFNATADGDLETFTLPVIATGLTPLNSSTNIYVGITYDNEVSALIGFSLTGVAGLELINIAPPLDPTMPIPNNRVPAATGSFPPFVSLYASFTTDNCTYYVAPQITQPAVDPQTSCFQSAFDLVNNANIIHVATAFPNESYAVNLTTPLSSASNIIRVTLPPLNFSYVNTSIYVTLNGQANGPYAMTIPFTIIPLSGFILTAGATNILTVTVSQSFVFPIDTPFIFTPTSSFCTNANTFSVSNPSTSQMVGDPLIVGLSGQSFQIHGIDGGVYNLISAPSFNLNSEFVFLTGPRLCPVMPSTGRRAHACWTHAGSYLANIGLVTNSHRVFIEAGDARTGFAHVEVDGATLSIGDTVIRAHKMDGVNMTVTLTSTHECTLSIGVFVIVVESIDTFLNLRSIHLVSPVAHSHSILVRDEIHGLIGQTWRPSPISVGKLKYIDGDSTDEYLLSSHDLFGHDFEYNRYMMSSNM